MKKILITGGTGFIGRQVINEFLSDNNQYEIHVITSSDAIYKFNKNVLVHKLNLLDQNAVNVFFKQYKFWGLIHLAWFVGAKCHVSDINLTWLQASLNLLQNFAQTGGQSFLGAGSVSEYDYSYGYLQEDFTPLNSNTLYGQSKAALFKIANIFCQQNNIDFKWARLFNMYCPHEKEVRLMPAAIISMLKNETVKVSPCEQIQDYLHVFDAAKAVVKLFKSEMQGAVNICSGIPIRLRDVVEQIAELTNFNGSIDWGALPASFSDLLVVGNNQKLKQQIGWQQEINLNNGLQMTIDWWRKNLNV